MCSCWCCVYANFCGPVLLFILPCDRSWLTGRPGVGQRCAQRISFIGSSASPKLAALPEGMLAGQLPKYLLLSRCYRVTLQTYRLSSDFCNLVFGSDLMILMFAKDNCAVQDTHKMQLIPPPMLPYLFLRGASGLDTQGGDRVGRGGRVQSTFGKLLAMGQVLTILMVFIPLFSIFSILFHQSQILTNPVTQIFSLNLPRSVTSVSFIIEIK